MIYKESLFKRKYECNIIEIPCLKKNVKTISSYAFSTQAAMYMFPLLSIRRL